MARFITITAMIQSPNNRVTAWPPLQKDRKKKRKKKEKEKLELLRRVFNSMLNELKPNATIVISAPQIERIKKNRLKESKKERGERERERERGERDKIERGWRKTR